jgi:hypothetical protein
MDASRAYRSDVAPDVLPEQQHLTEEESPRRATFTNQGPIPAVAQGSDVEGLTASQIGYDVSGYYGDGSKLVCRRTYWPARPYECYRTMPAAPATQAPAQAAPATQAPAQAAPGAPTASERIPWDPHRWDR